MGRSIWTANCPKWILNPVMSHNLSPGKLDGIFLVIRPMDCEMCSTLLDHSHLMPWNFYALKISLVNVLYCEHNLGHFLWFAIKVLLSGFFPLCEISDTWKRSFVLHFLNTFFFNPSVEFPVCSFQC